MLRWGWHTFFGAFRESACPSAQFDTVKHLSVNLLKDLAKNSAFSTLCSTTSSHLHENIQHKMTLTIYKKPLNFEKCDTLSVQILEKITLKKCQVSVFLMTLTARTQSFVYFWIWINSCFLRFSGAEIA